MHNPAFARIFNSGPLTAPLAVFVLALLLFSINLDRPPHPDELHHVLAGQHLMETGRPIIAEGEYWRGVLYTWLVAGSYELLGESLSSARLPAVVVTALVAAILFVWIRMESKALAAWIASALFVTSPFVVEIAQFSRFYCLQMLFFTLCSICTFYAFSTTSSVARQTSLGTLAIGFLLLSVWMQETSLIGLIGLAVWMAGTSMLWGIRALTGRQAAWRFLVTALVVSGVLALLAVTLSDQFTWAWERYRTASLFAAGNMNEFWYYHLRYVMFYPTMWPLIGVLTLIAADRSPRITWFAVTIFGVSFLLTSFAAQKGTRYFSYAQPMLSILWGIGLGVALPALWRSTESARARLGNSLALPAEMRPGAVRALTVFALGVVLLMNPFWLRTASIIGNVSMPIERPVTDWRVAHEALTPWVTSVGIMITTEELGAIYFLGRSDVRFSPSKIHELPSDQRFEFGIDPRTGRPIIARSESLERLVKCFDSGLVVGPIEHWGSPILIDAAVQDVIRRHAGPIPVPRRSHLYAWGWQRPPGALKPVDCVELARFSNTSH